MRLRLGWSQERLAREIGVSFCTVNRWEKGRSAPSPMAARFLKGLSQRLGPGISDRASVRLPLRLPLNVNTKDARRFSSSTENISLGGLMFKAEEAFRPGDKLSLELMLGEGAPLKLASEVVWAGRKGAPDVGVRFGGLSPADSVMLVNTMFAHI